MKRYINAESPADALKKLPKLGEPHPDYGLKIVQYDVCRVPRSFWDWLRGKPSLWEVNVTFETKACV